MGKGKDKQRLWGKGGREARGQSNLSEWKGKVDEKVNHWPCIIYFCFFSFAFAREIGRGSSKEAG